MKTTITAKLFGLEYQGKTHELTAITAADLSAQVQLLTGQRQAGQLARMMWQADRADLSAAGVRLVSLGQIQRVMWASLPAARTTAEQPATWPADTAQG